MSKKLKAPATKVKIVIFDLDGTLMNAYPAVYRSVNYTVQSLGYPAISHATIKRTVGWGDRHLLQSFIRKEDVEKAVKIYRRHHGESLKTDTKLLRGSLKILQYLKSQDFKLAVASNRPTKFSKIAIKYLEIEKYFDFVLCGDKVKNPKPAPDILKEILKRFSLKSSQALYVGDMGIDIMTGRRAQVKTVAVATGSNTAAELAALKPFDVIKNVYEVKSILNRLS